MRVIGLLNRLLPWHRHPHQDHVDEAVRLQQEEDREIIDAENERIQRMEDEIAVLMREHDDHGE